MSTLRRRRIDSTIEKRIVTGMIVSKKFLQEIWPSVNANYFENTFTRRIAEWALRFFREYDDAPHEHIQDIFNRERAGLKEEDADLISKLLLEISQRYESSDGINVDYLLDQSLAFFKKRELQITSANIDFLLDQNKIEDAEEQIVNFHKISRLTSNWTNPFDAKNVREVFSEAPTFLRFPGELGNFLDEFERSWLVGISGTFKKGKTWFLQEFAILGVLTGKRVAMFSLEMPQRKMNERIYKRLIGAGAEEGIHPYPVFDCLLNQEGTCERDERTNRHTLRDSQGLKPDFDPAIPYRPCVYCKENRIRDYKVDFWFEGIERPKFSRQYVERKIATLRDMYNDSFRLKVYPRFSANLADINRDLDILEQTEGFIADIILVDYADILKPEREGQSGVEKEDETWMGLSQLAGTRHALVVAPTQLRRSALDKKKVSQSDSALWIGKLAHVDVMLSLNQTEYEKDCGAMRVGIMVHRFKEFSEELNCYMLQKLNFGQVNLESYISR